MSEYTNFNSEIHSKEFYSITESEYDEVARLMAHGCNKVRLATENQLESFQRLSAVGSARIRQVLEALPQRQPYNEIVDHCHRLRRFTYPQPAISLPQTPVSSIMQPVFDHPVLAHDLQPAFRIRLFGASAADSVDRLLAPLASRYFFNRSLDFEDLPKPRPIHLPRSQAAAGDPSLLKPPMLFVGRFSLLQIIRHRLELSSAVFDLE